MTTVHLRLKVKPSNVQQGPFASMQRAGLDFNGDTASRDLEYSTARKRIQLTIMGDKTASCDYEVFDGEDLVRKGTAKVTEGDTAVKIIRFYFKKR